MNIFEKLARSWWVLLSVIFFINGFGFIYLGFKTQNKNWVIEGITYELPWIFMLPFSNVPPVFGGLMAVAILLMLISFIRSVWVDMKYLDMREKHI